MENQENVKRIKKPALGLFSLSASPSNPPCGWPARCGCRLASSAYQLLTVRALITSLSRVTGWSVASSWAARLVILLDACFMDPTCQLLATIFFPFLDPTTTSRWALSCAPVDLLEAKKMRWTQPPPRFSQLQDSYHQLACSPGIGDI
jgi:hypothetical protein